MTICRINSVTVCVQCWITNAPYTLWSCAWYALWFASQARMHHTLYDRMCHILYNSMHQRLVSQPPDVDSLVILTEGQPYRINIVPYHHPLTYLYFYRSEWHIWVFLSIHLWMYNEASSVRRNRYSSPVRNHLQVHTYPTPEVIQYNTCSSIIYNTWSNATFRRNAM